VPPNEIPAKPKNETPLVIRAEAGAGEQEFKLVLKNALNQPTKCSIDEKLAQSILIQFLVADGAFRTIGAGDGEIIVTGPISGFEV
jgi:hypothetical protein